jgi:1-deoxy-D-xylulose-5-phosphate reductoisomerase
MPCILNAANEIVVAEFLKGRVGFLQMSDIIADCMAKISYIAAPNFEDYLTTDKETRIKTLELIN